MASHRGEPESTVMHCGSLKPFLKWAGGKRWLLESGQFELPRVRKRYIEPFLGGGAIFFALQPQHADLSDANQRLIELYVVIRDRAVEFEQVLRLHAESHSKQYYYDVRSAHFTDVVCRAAQFLYLNRTCWNGLYRENLHGKFNVPIGTKNSVIFESDDFQSWAKALSSANLTCRDFEDAIEGADGGDFIFADPPYTVRHNMNGFVKYNQKIFAWRDQVRLRDALVRASERGASFALTNANHESVRELYRGVGRHACVGRHSVLSGRAVHRAYSTELLITSC
jgi:DNA adenine methylase